MKVKLLKCSYLQALHILNRTHISGHDPRTQQSKIKQEMLAQDMRKQAVSTKPIGEWGGGGGLGGVGGLLPIYGVVRMCVPNGPLFQRCQVYD